MGSQECTETGKAGNVDGAHSQPRYRSGPGSFHERLPEQDSKISSP